MKHLFSKLMLAAFAALTFVACEDVPEPYDIPGTGTNIPGTVTELEGGTGTGTVSDPFNAIAAINFGKTLASGEESEKYYYVKGKVVSIKEEFTTQYGNGTFYISEDGTATNQFYAYRVSYLGNQKFADGDEQIKVGDEVIVCGIITNYNSTIETAQNKGFLYSLNGVNRGGEPKDPTPAAEPAGDGTLANPYNVSGVLQYIGTLGTDESPNQVYVKGKISRITEEFSTQYGNGTFYISDDGEASNEFYAFRVLYLGNKKFANGDTQIQKGDEVILCGNVVNFRGNTPETVQNKAFLYSLNGVSAGGDNPTPTGEAKGTGTLDDPFNAAAAIAYAQSVGSGESDKDVYIKGKVSSVKEQYGTQYGNATFYISDDGEASGEFYVFRALYLGNQKYTSGDQLQKGDEVIVCGRVTCYMGNTPETVQNKAFLYSLNGKTEGGGTTPTPQPAGEAKGDGTEANPFNSVAANAFAAALAAGAESDHDVYIAGKVVSVKEQYGTQYGNASFYISDDGTTADQFYVFRALYLGNEKYTSGTLLQKGDDVVICGRLTNYMGNTPETAQGKAWLVSMKSNGGDTPGGDTPGGEVSGNSITADFTAMNFENAQEISTLTLSDGTTLTFGAGTNKNAPKYYNSGTSIRMYPTNTLTATAATGKTIAGITLTCSANNAEGNVSANPGTVAVSDMTVTISDINAATTTVTNAHTGTGAASQLRISKMAITYKE